MLIIIPVEANRLEFTKPNGKKYKAITSEIITEMIPGISPPNLAAKITANKNGAAEFDSKSGHETAIMTPMTAGAKKAAEYSMNRDASLRLTIFFVKRDHKISKIRNALMSNNLCHTTPSEVKQFRSR